MNIIYQTSRRLRIACRGNSFYQILSQWDCGAFDGGCLMFALALQRTLRRGELYGIWGTPKRFPTKGDEDYPVREPAFQHALVQIAPGFYMDGDGLTSQKRLIERWKHQELVEVVDIRPLDPKQMPDPPVDQDTIVRLSKWLETETNINWKQFIACMNAG